MGRVLLGLWLCVIGCGLVYANSESGAPCNLACEYLTNPLGIDESAPRLFWQVSDPRRGAAQTAYQILVSSDRDLLDRDRGDMWDTGKVQSSQSIQIAYSGKPLISGTRYYWKVRTWDIDGKPSPYSDIAYWQMGLKKADWKAKWIGFGGKLPHPSRRHNGYHSQISNNADAVKWVVVDLGEKQTIDAVRFYPAHLFDWKDTPGFLYPVRFRIDASNDPGFDKFNTVYDATQKDVENPGDAAQTYSFKPIDARYVRLYVTKLANRDEENYGFALAEMQVLDGGKNLALEKVVTALDTTNSDSWSQDRLTDGVVKSMDPGKNWNPHPAPVFRKTFAIKSPVVRGTLTATALGLYEISINGKRVGENVLAPEWTDYHTRVQYQTYDVTGHLKQGKNAIGAILGEGWYAGRVGLMNRFRVYGDRLALLAQIDVECEDGSRQTIVTDPTWKGTLNGPIRGGDIIHGEILDSRKEMPGWDRPGFNDDDWKSAEIVQTSDVPLVAQPNEPIRITQEITPLSVSEPKPNVFVYDLGQNIVGWCRVTANGSAGKKLTLRYAEVLNPDGTVYTENLRGPFQVDEWTLSGVRNCAFEPHFTYHGFRYLQIEGLDEPLPLKLIEGCAFHSSSPIVRTFECSNPSVNKLMENILWTQRGNMHSTPTDCPQRDERLGWMGDAQIFSQAACFNMNMAAFYTKWLQDIRDAQSEDGQYSDFSPNPLMPQDQFLAAPAWADAGVIVPWRMYENYADVRILERHYESMQRWVEYVQKNSKGYIWTDGRGNDYGDWLNADTLILENWPKKGGEISKEQIATAFSAHSTDLLSRIAAVLGKKDDAKRYAELFEKIRAAYVQKYFGADGKNIDDNQTAYALALHFNLLPKEQRRDAVNRILKKIDEYNGHISTGIQATNRMMLELANEGECAAAYRLLNNRTIPSWNYMIDNGATTIWERWDGWVKDRGFQSAGMNSFNHYALGAVSEWIVRNIAGVNPVIEEPAYGRVLIHPQPGGGLTYANVRTIPSGDVSKQNG